MLGWYQLQLRTRPLLTQSITTAFLFATGDYLAQQIVEQRTHKHHSIARTLRMAGYGGLAFGPAATLWYSRVLPRIKFSSYPVTIGARVVTDQVVFAGTNLFIFLSTMSILEGGDPKAKLESSYLEALKRNWMIWPPVQVANFTVVPLEHRVLVVNIVSIGWNCYLSYINSKGGKPSEPNVPS